MSACPCCSEPAEPEVGAWGRCGECHSLWRLNADGRVDAIFDPDANCDRSFEST